MTVGLLDTPNNGKLVSFTDPADIGETGEVVLDSIAKPDQAFVAVNTDTGEGYLVHNGVVTSLGAFARYEYDFATDGGAVGTINLRGPQIPNNARVIRGFAEVTTAFTSGGAATVALTIPTDDANGLLASDTLANNSLDSTGLIELIQTGTAANASEKTTAARTPGVVVGTAALTAGAIEVFLQIAVEKN